MNLNTLEKYNNRASSLTQELHAARANVRYALFEQCKDLTSRPAPTIAELKADTQLHNEICRTLHIDLQNGDARVFDDITKWLIGLRNVRGGVITMGDRHKIGLTFKLSQDHTPDRILAELTQIVGVLDLIKHPKRNSVEIAIIAPNGFNHKAYVIDKDADLREIAGLAHTALMR